MRYTGNKYYQLQMNTFCMQNAGIPVTNIISFDLVLEFRTFLKVSGNALLARIKLT